MPWLATWTADLASIAFVSAITGPVFGGIFPVLMLAANRRKGEYSRRAIFRLLRHSDVIVAVYPFFLMSIFDHGLVLRTDPVRPSVAVLAWLVMLGMNVIVVRRGAFAPLVVVELRAGQSIDGRGIFNVIEGGEPAPADVWFHYGDGERWDTRFRGTSLSCVQLRESRGVECKVWAHPITPEGKSEALAARLEMQCAAETYRRALSRCGG